MDQLSCRGLARGHHPIQGLTFLDGQGHLVLLHRGTPSLGPKSSHGLKESRSHSTCQLKMDGTLAEVTRIRVDHRSDQRIDSTLTRPRAAGSWGVPEARPQVESFALLESLDPVVDRLATHV